MKSPRTQLIILIACYFVVCVIILIMFTVCVSCSTHKTYNKKRPTHTRWSNYDNYCPAYK